jgi:hypothetical protein
MDQIVPADVVAVHARLLPDVQADHEHLLDPMIGLVFCGQSACMTHRDEQDYG